MKKITLAVGLLALIAQVALVSTAFAGTIQFVPAAGGSNPGGNSAPVFTAPSASSFSVPVGNNLQFTVSANDPDGDSLLYTVSGLPTGATFGNNANPIFSWTPSAGQAGSYSVTFHANDGQITINKPVTITVTSASGGSGSGNLAPTFTSPNFSSMSVGVGQQVSFPVIANDPEGQTVTYSVMNAPNGSSFGGQQFSWTPNSNQAGSYSFTFQATDGVNTVDKPMTIFVMNQFQPNPNPCFYQNCYGNNFYNNAPVITSPSDSSYTVGAGQTLTLHVTAYDIDGDGLTYQAINIPINASWSGSSDRTFTWQPAFNQTGSYTVTFRVSDGKTFTDKTVTLYASTVAYPYNNAPVFDQPTASSFNVNIGQSLEFNVHATDADSDPIVYTISNAPTGASFTGQFFSFRPTNNQVGTFTVTFRASDNKTYTDKVVTINAGLAPNAPRFVGFNAPTTVREGQLYLYTANAVSPNGSALKYRIVTGPQGLVVNPTFGTILWVPNYNQARPEPYLVTVGAADNVAEGAQSFYITVIDAPAPIVTPTVTRPSNGGGLVGTPVVPAEDVLQLSNVRIESQEGGEVVVRFDTNKPAYARAIYDVVSQADRATDFTYANATLETAVLATSHEITIADLQENTGYYLRAVAKTEDGEIAYSAERVIVRLPDNTVQDLTLASVLGSIGRFINDNPALLIIVIGLGIIGTMVYFRRKNSF